MQSQWTEMPGEYPGISIRIPKAFSESWIQIWYLFLSLFVHKLSCAYRVLVLSIPSQSLSVLIYICYFGTFMHHSLIWISIALLSGTHINRALFCVHGRCPMFHCQSLCQSKIECWYLILLIADCFAFVPHLLCTSLGIILFTKFSASWFQVIFTSDFKKL